MEGLIHFLADIGGRMECIQKEAENPKPDLSQEEDPVKKAIKELLCQNTGCDILDSGGAYGRSWEKNRHKDFDTEDSVELDVWDDEVSISYNVYHYLVNFLTLNDKCEQLQKELETFMEREDSRSYLQDIEDFMEYKRTHDNYESQGVVNTYNYDNIISQILQYGIMIDEEDEHFIVLQIHNGCDCRGGYTKPRIFSLGEDDGWSYFEMAQRDITARCKKCNMSWYSDDSGYNWYSDGCYSSQEAIPNGEEPDTELKIKTDPERNSVYHKGCKGEIEYYVTESW